MTHITRKVIFFYLLEQLRKEFNRKYIIENFYFPIIKQAENLMIEDKVLFYEVDEDGEIDDDYITIEDEVKKLLEDE